MQYQLRLILKPTDYIPALSLITDVSLSLFLTMSLMSSQLRTLAGVTRLVMVLLLFQLRDKFKSNCQHEPGDRAL
ncbi:MAG: hypothetical protein IGQ88_00335 [Gloeomargaritaceae cyanobacterium C42_A2020_066]|nr:hypothetical protein [Gloeomargaritaceae cyanobacterium C42_A2020_066]